MRAWGVCGGLPWVYVMQVTLCCGVSFGDLALGHCSPQRCTCCRTVGWWDLGIPNLPVSATACSSRWLLLLSDPADDQFTEHQVPDSHSRSSCPDKWLFIPVLPEGRPQERSEW